jgi:hypothetical protein
MCGFMAMRSQVVVYQGSVNIPSGCQSNILYCLSQMLAFVPESLAILLYTGQSSLWAPGR